MTHFIKDNTGLGAAKSNFRTEPLVPATQKVGESDWNRFRQALLDVQSFLRGADWIGFSLQAEAPTPTGVDNFLWIDDDGKLHASIDGEDTIVGSDSGSGGTAPGVFGNRFHGDVSLSAGIETGEQHRFYGDLTIPSGATFTWSRTESISSLGNRGFLLFVDGTLTIESGGSIDLSGDDAVADVGGQGAGNGGADTAGANGTIGNGGDASDRFETYFNGYVTDGKGGNGGDGSGGTGGVGGIADTYSSSASPPFALSLFSPISNGLGALGAGAGGGGGAGDGALPGGGGGGPGGILYIFARHVAAVAGSIKARGGAGAAGPTTNTGGGGGGMGGVIVIYTLDEDIDDTIFDVTGGAGGGGGGGTGMAGEAGTSGRVCIVTPSGARWIG